MTYLQGKEEQEAAQWLTYAGKIALQATCQRDKCGSVIVKNNEIIGVGFNSPPCHKESQRRCLDTKENYHVKVKDKTCCVHAEQRAIMDALQKNPDKVQGSRLYFMRLDEKGKLSRAGRPYCTICSKMTLDAGIAGFVLWHAEGIKVYNTEEYNLFSFNYRG